MCQPQKEGRDGHFPATFGRAGTKNFPAFVTQLILSDPFSGHDLSSAAWALMASLHLSICTNRGFHSKAPLSPKHSCITSDFLPKHRDPHPWEVSSSRKTIPAPLDFRGYKSPSNSVTRETVQDAEPGPLPTSSLPSAAQGKQVAVIHSTLRFFNQGGHRSPPALLGSVDLQSGLQLPQNIRPTVCALSRNLSLFGNEPRCNPLEMTKGTKAQL